MDVHVPTKDHKIFQWYGFASHPFNVLLAEVGGVDDCISAVDVIRDGFVGEAEEGDEFDGGLAGD